MNRAILLSIADYCPMGSLHSNYNQQLVLYLTASFPTPTSNSHARIMGRVRGCWIWGPPGPEFKFSLASSEPTAWPGWAGPAWEARGLGAWAV